MFHALSDATRRHMVIQLSKAPTSVSELAKPLKMSMPAVLQHLQVLEECGLIRSEKAGRVRTCHIEQKALSEAERWIVTLRELHERRLDRLAVFLAEDKPPSTKRRKP